MNINFDNQQGVQVVEFDGDFDGSASEYALNTVMNRLNEEFAKVAPDEHMVVLNMDKCRFISSAGLRTLLLLAKEFNRLEARAAMCCVDEDVKDVMEMTGFQDLFRTFDTLKEALAFVREKSK